MPDPSVATPVDLVHTLVRWRYRRLGFTRGSLDLGNASLSYVHFENPSARRSIVLLHGLGTSSSTWLRILHDLRKDSAILAPDLPGFGGSILAGDRTYCALAEHDAAIENVLDLVSTRPFTLVGHSLGGWLAMRYALKHPATIARLVLINPAGVLYEGIETLRQLFSIQTPADVRRLLDAMWYRYPWYFRPFTAAIFNYLKRRGIPEFVNTVVEKDFLGEELKQLKMPVSLIWGKEDHLISGRTIDILAGYIPQLHTFTIERCGHIPQLERPAQLRKTLHKILEEG
ncbi:MAG: alpha/beta fold hydrolase [Bacteroidota bacterium]